MDESEPSPDDKKLEQILRNQTSSSQEKIDALEEWYTQCPQDRPQAAHPNAMTQYLIRMVTLTLSLELEDLGLFAWAMNKGISDELLLETIKLHTEECLTPYKAQLTQ